MCPALENFSGPLRKFAPGQILIVDAADTGSSRGAISYHTLEDAQGISAFTHGLPPTVFGKFIQNELNCQVDLLLIQAEEVGFDTRMGIVVEQAVIEVARELGEFLEREGYGSKVL